MFKSYWSSAVFCLFVWIFFGIIYRHHLHYQEETQLFLFTGAYFGDSVMIPGGLTSYISCFITQFFTDSLAGAFLLALLLLVLQILARKSTVLLSDGKCCFRALSFVPAIFCFFALMDENFTPGIVVALIFSFLSTVASLLLKNNRSRLFFILPAIPALYFAAGFSAVVFVFLSLVYAWRKEKSVFFALAAISVYAASVYCASLVFEQYSLTRLFFAGEYYRFPQIYPLALILVFVASIAIPSAAVFMPEARQSKRIRTVAGSIFLCLLTVCGVSEFAGMKKEEVLAYNYFSRMKKWNSILKTADGKAPDSPLSVAALNLALSKNNTLSEFMFHYFQNGTEGLLPEFRKDYVTNMMTGEIYYHLGLINTAQRFAFEAMESLPDRRKSVRSIRRLAETSLINGQYEVCRKYLSILRKTLFYRKWAEETMKLSESEEKIDSHEEYGLLRRFRPQNDFLFSEHEKDMILGMLYRQNNRNRAAYEYLLAFQLLKKDLKKFYLYYRLKNRTDTAVPESYGEALAVISRQKDMNLQFHDSAPENRIVEAFVDFSNRYRNNCSEKQLFEMYGKTYWYYLTFRSN